MSLNISSNNNAYLRIPYFEKPSDNTLSTEYGYVEFPTKEHFIEYLWKQFKFPGQYQYNNITQYVKMTSSHFEKHNIYCDFVEGTYEYREFWNKEKEKCLNGVIIFDGQHEWYFPGDYYFWLNYLPIYNKSKKRNTFPELRDVQHYMALYECLAEHMGKHAVIVKRRQIASSYYHMAKLIHRLWFYQSPFLKLISSSSNYIETDWKYLSEYRDFLNTYSGWYRPMQPDTYLHWEQKQEIRENGIKRYVGLKGILKAFVISDDPTAGVGGPTTLAFYEEPGISRNILDTFHYMLPSMMDGMTSTGLFIAAGSVGDMDQSKGLRSLMYDGEMYNILMVDNPMVDEHGSIRKTGLFIPEQYGMPPYIDEYGNSLVTEALESIRKEREKLKRLTIDEYRIYLSQRPITLEEAFYSRRESRFPMDMVNKQKQRIREGKFPYECVELRRRADGSIEATTTNKRPIDIYPTPSDYPYKEGAIQVWEKPIPNAPPHTYIASVDPISEDKTITSNSLFSIYVMRSYIEKRVVSEEDVEAYVMQPQIVACWTGRLENIEKTNEQAMLLAEWYNARIICENNVSTFINYAIKQKQSHRLMTKNELLFLKELNYNNTVMQEYGWRNTGDLFRNHMISYLIQFMKEEIGEEALPMKEKTEDGSLRSITRKVYGIERIPDLMLLEEIDGFENDKNTDRLVAVAALITYLYIRTANYGYQRMVEKNYKDKKAWELANKINQYYIYKQTHSVIKPWRRGSYFKNLR